MANKKQSFLWLFLKPFMNSFAIIFSLKKLNLSKKRFYGFCVYLKLAIGNLLRLREKRKTSNKAKEKLLKLLFSLIQYYNHQVGPIIISFLPCIICHSLFRSQANT